MKTEQELKDIFGKNVYTRRNRMGWSQEKLAEKVGVSRNIISEIETGKNFAYAKTIVSLAIAFETEVYELFKPENVLPDRSPDILAQFSEEIREKVEVLGNSYIEKMKK